jgi:hypothetical protein
MKLEVEAGFEEADISDSKWNLNSYKEKYGLFNSPQIWRYWHIKDDNSAV